jgi:hypothetical protein
MTRAQMLDRAVERAARKMTAPAPSVSHRQLIKLWSCDQHFVPKAEITKEFRALQRTRAFL